MERTTALDKRYIFLFIVASAGICLVLFFVGHQKKAVQLWQQANGRNDLEVLDGTDLCVLAGTGGMTGIQPKNLPMLVFRVSRIHCAACITENIALLQRMSEMSSGTRVAVFAHGFGPRQFRMLRESLESSRIFVEKVERLESDSIGRPYFFLVSPDLRSYDYFVPVLRDTATTSSYLKYVLSTAF